MTIQISYREHRSKPAIYNPVIYWSKPESGIFRGRSIDHSLGHWYMFFVVPRSWIHGKYLRWRWMGSGFTAHAEIWDGEYNRRSMVDFPDRAPPISKGNGTLQVLASNVGTFAMETKDVQIDTSGGSEENVTIIFWSFDNSWTLGGQFDLDWIEINGAAGGAGNLYSEQFDTAIIYEKIGSYNDYGYIGAGLVPESSIDLPCRFNVAQPSQNLKAIFFVRQGWEDLPASFFVLQGTEDLLGGFIVQNKKEEELLGKFDTRHIGVPVELHGAFDIQGVVNLSAKIIVTKYYNLEGTGGIAFFWWGAENPPEALNQLILMTPTGFWYTDFYDGYARFRLIKIPWGDFIWVSSAQRLLEPHYHGFNVPDKTRVNGFIWTIHTPGMRRLDYVYAYPRAPSNLLGYFIIRKTALPLNLLAKFIPRRTDNQDLIAGFHMRNPGSENLLASFRIRQDIENLLAGFISRGAGIQELPARFWGSSGRESEDFEDEILVNHYQHFDGTGIRSTMYPHTGIRSWRTPQGSYDIFDISDGQVLTAAKVVVWTIYGNSTRKIELLDRDLNILAQTTWGTTYQYIQKTVEASGAAVKYLKITCPSGLSSAIWTDDITIYWANQTPRSRNLLCGFTVNNP